MVLNRVPAKTWQVIVLHIVALTPLAWLGLDAILGNLSINPYEDLVRRTGQAAILGVILTLSCTPLVWLFNHPILLSLRKPLGLYAFLYALLHVSTFVVMGYHASIQLAIAEITARPFLTIGATAFLILLILAITSNRASQNLLSKKWKTYHRLFYLAALLAGVHYLMARKIPSNSAMLAAAIIAALLLFRLVWLFRRKPI